MQKPGGWDLFTPYEVYENGTMWTGLHIGEKLVGLRLRAARNTNSSKISATVFLVDEPGRSEKQLIKRVLAEKLGVDDDLGPFYKFARRDPILRHATEDLYGMHDTLGGSLFDLAILAICLQLAPLKRSEQMMDCLVSKYGDVAEFDGRSVRVWPTPSALSKASIEELERECRLGYRAKYIVQLTRTLQGNFPTLEDLALMPPDESKRKLLELPGVGDYSADIINPRNGFPIDAWSVDVFGKLFFRREPKNARAAIDAVKKEGLRRWGRWSWLAFFYVVHDLQNLSKKLKIKLRLR